MPKHCLEYTTQPRSTRWLCRTTVWLVLHSFFGSCHSSSVSSLKAIADLLEHLLCLVATKVCSSENCMMISFFRAHFVNSVQTVVIIMNQIILVSGANRLRGYTSHPAAATLRWLYCRHHNILFIFFWKIIDGTPVSDSGNRFDLTKFDYSLH